MKEFIHKPRRGALHKRLKEALPVAAFHKSLKPRCLLPVRRQSLNEKNFCLGYWDVIFHNGTEWVWKGCGPQEEARVEIEHAE